MLRLRPSRPEPRPRPLAASSSGVWIAPAATTTASAWTVSRPARGGGGLDRDGAPAAHDDPRRPGAGHDDRARCARGREVGVAGVLLGARGAAVGADAAPLAAARVAAQVAARPAQPLGAAADQRGVRAGELGRDLRDAQRRLDAVEARRERRGRELVQAVLGTPGGEHAVGGAEAGAGVDERRAAEAAAEREEDRRAPGGGDLPAVAVEAGEHVPRAAGQRRGGMRARPPRARRRARRPRRAPGRRRPRPPRPR